MDEIREIVEALEHCKGVGSETCKGCPYRHADMVGDMICRQRLCDDAAKAIRELQEKQTSVGSIKTKEEKPGIQEAIIKELPRKAVEAVKEAQYWRGYAAALQWAFDGRFEDKDDGAEVTDDV